MKDNATVSERYQTVLSRISEAAIRAGRDPASVTLIAVSKKQSIEAIEELYQAGQRDFGENYVQELVEKAQALRAKGYSDIRWHFIGHLQTNKIKGLLAEVSSIHSVDSLRLAQELAKQCGKLKHAGKLPVFIEVNISAEASKSGLVPEFRPVQELAWAIGDLSELELQGLMCVPSPEESEALLATRFARLKELGESCRPPSLGALSMGMSADFELAIAQGSTHVRVGTALFGPRSPG